MDMNTLILKLMKVIVEHSNAQKGTFFSIDESRESNQKETLLVHAEYEILDDDFER